MREQIRYRLVVRHGHRQRAGRGRISRQQRQREDRGVPRQLSNRRGRARIRMRAEQARGPVPQEGGVEFQQSARRFGRIVKESGFQRVENRGLEICGVFFGEKGFLGKKGGGRGGRVKWDGI